MVTLSGEAGNPDFVTNAPVIAIAERAADLILAESNAA